MPRATRLVLTVLVAFTVLQGFSLVGRASRADSDFSIFYRNGQLLKLGVGTSLYPRVDAVTGFPISLSPAGLAILQPLSSLGPTAASAVWAVVNLSLVGLSIGVFGRFLRMSNSPRLATLFPAAAMVFMILSAGCIQVGQFSVLFVTCWLLFLLMYQEQRYGWAGVFLALPVAIKVYPLLLL